MVAGITAPLFATGSGATQAPNERHLSVVGNTFVFPKILDQKEGGSEQNHGFLLKILPIDCKKPSLAV